MPILCLAKKRFLKTPEKNNISHSPQHIPYNISNIYKNPGEAQPKNNGPTP
jgi:hypothetical protein